MKKSYTMIAVDMDGTLLKSDKTIHEDSIRDIANAVEKGIEIAYCTGRALAELQPYFAVLPMIRYAVCYSGAIVYDCIEKKCLYRSEIARNEIGAIVATAKKYHAMVHFMTEKESIVSAQDITHMEDFSMGVYQPLYEKVTRQVDDMEDESKLHASIPKINIYFRAEEDRNRGYEELKNLPLTFAFAEKTGLEMNAQHVTKAAGLLELSRILGIPISQIAGIGDAENDRAMLSKVGFPIAMGNASDEIKALCQWITKDNDHNGVGEAIRYLVS